MRNSVLMAATIALGGMTMPLGGANANDWWGDSELVCYRLDAFPAERLKLDVKKHSLLSDIEEVVNFDHAFQVSYDVHGKLVGTCGAGTMGAIDGTAITARLRMGAAGQAGAHLGLETHVSRAGDSCRSVTFDCTTSDVSATPNTWDCFIRNDFGLFLGESTLTRVDETEDPLCSIFQDGASVTSSVAASGPATGLKQ